MKITPWNRFIL